MAQNIEERRRSVLEAMLLGFEEDLDDLRYQLSRELKAYEGRLDSAVSGMPSWLVLESTWVRDWFQYDVDSGQTLLGPRSVALAASHLEALVQAMFGPPGGPYSWPDEEEFASRSAELQARFDLMESRARACALDIEENLSETLDEIIADLESTRERDERALRELISAGELDRGEGTQREIADLWEDQRTRTHEIKQIWEPLERLAFEGIQGVGVGLLQLRELLNHVESLALGVREDRPAQTLEEDDTPRVTEALPRQESTDEWERGVVSDDGEGNVGEPESEWGVTDPDLPGPTSRLPTAEDDVMTAEELRQEDTSPRAIPAVSSLPVLTPKSTTSEAPPKKNEPRIEPVKPKTSGVIRCVASRVIVEWQPVSTAEKLLIAGPFLIYSMVFGVGAGSAIAGSPLPTVTGWWVFPWGYLGVVAWLVIGAFVRHWRIDWPLRLVEWAEFEEEVALEISDAHIQIGKGRLEAEALNVTRWQSDEHHVGWIVSGPEMGVHAVERDYSRWSASKRPVETRYAELWEVPEGSLEAILQGRT